MTASTSQTAGRVLWTTEAAPLGWPIGGKMSEPREYTTEEVREMLLRHIWGLIHYWEHDSRTADLHGKMTGLAFSILSTLDGSSVEIPSFLVAPSPHPDDREYHKENGENWFPENHENEINCDIGGVLHEWFHSFDPDRKED
jgi:hypothetical protein